MKKFLLFTLSILFFYSCASDSSEDLIDPDPNPSTTITYKANVKSIMDTSCATSGCHDTATNASGLTLETYAQVKDAVDNEGVIGRMENTGAPMPPSGLLPSTTVTIIKNWKSQGYID